MKKTLFFIVSAVFLISTAAQAATLLYSQDFEQPSGFVNDGGDVNIYRSVNTLYGEQPPGFVFTQAYTVETLLITGNSAFGTGYSDPSGTGGNYALGMLSSLQDDLLALGFNIGTNNFLNINLDISSIDLSVFSGPFVSPGDIPVFEFTLYDNPGGASSLGSGAILSSMQATGTASDQSVFEWTNVLLSLDAAGNTDGNVVLRIDLLEGGYAAMDNFTISASENQVPVPGTFLLLFSGLLGMLSVNRKHN